jgi:L-malate glycosyltransferase
MGESGRSILFLADAGNVHTQRWTKFFCSEGYKVIVCSFTKCRIAGATVIHMNRRWRLPGKVDYLLQSRMVNKAVAEFRPAIVHAHYASSYGFLGALTGFHPFVLSVWGSDVFLFPKRSFLHSAILQYCFSKADFLCSTSCAMADEVRKYTSKNIHITPFGVDTASYQAMGTPSVHRRIIGTIKRLDPVYGIDTLIEAFALLKRRNIPVDRLVIGGHGPQRGQLEQMVAQLGLGNDVEFLGQVPQEDVPRQLSRMAVFVALSRSESFGVAVLEASACGVPVVVSSVGGLPEVVADGISGLVVPPDDPVAAADAVEKLLRDEELYRHMSENARMLVKNRFEWKDACQIMKALYSMILGDKANEG